MDFSSLSLYFLQLQSCIALCRKQLIGFNHFQEFFQAENIVKSTTMFKTFHVSLYLYAAIYTILDPFRPSTSCVAFSFIWSVILEA